MKYKASAFLLALTMALPYTTPIWAAEEQTAEAIEMQEDIEESEESEEKAPELTFADALQKAKKNSTELRSAKNQSEYLQELKEDAWDAAGDFSVPQVNYQKWVNDRTYSLYSNIQSISSNMTKNKYSTEITEISLEATVKNYFISILSNESALDLAEKKAEMQKALYEQGVEKEKLGVISAYALKDLENAYQTAQDNVRSLEKTIQESYRNFYNFIGEKEDAEYTLVYDLEYEPYSMSRSMEQYISDRLRNDYTLLQKEQAVEDAEFSMYYLSESTTNTQNKTNKYNYQEAKNSLKTAKQEKELAIKNAYDAILQLEDSYTSAENALEIAKSDLLLAELQYELGRTTELEKKQAELAVEQAEEDLRQIVYAHDLQIYQFEHTELLSAKS